MVRFVLFSMLAFFCVNSIAAAADTRTSAKPILKKLYGTSTWQNQSGSTMTITVSSRGTVSGQYINREAGYQCQNSFYPVSGWMLGTSISFSVKWTNSVENCNSVTGWTGYYDTASKKIVTKWNLAISGSASPSKIMQGQDEFTRIAIKVNASILN